MTSILGFGLKVKRLDLRDFIDARHLVDKALKGFQNLIGFSIVGFRKW